MNKRLFVGLVFIAFLFGLIGGRLISGNHDVDFKVERNGSDFCAYTYYLDRHGSEVKHGWMYTYTFNGLFEREDWKKFKDNVEVESRSKTHHESDKIGAPAERPSTTMPSK